MKSLVDDNALIEGSIIGERWAFREIVAKYQALIHSVAYSITGDLPDPILPPKGSI